MQTGTDDKWDRRFLELADQIATWSKDPNRGVGAVIVSGAKQIVATGFNGLPRGVRLTRLDVMRAFERVAPLLRLEDLPRMKREDERARRRSGAK